MSNLVVLGLDNREDAERVMDLTGELAKQHLLELEDVAYAYKDDKGKVRIHQAISLTGAGAASGALWGTLIGMLFLMPIAGLAIGAGTGALAGKLSDVGINDDTIKQIGEQLFMAESTAGVHVSNILGKLGVSRRHEAAAVAHRIGLGVG
mgnify:CR=1 FL=1